MILRVVDVVGCIYRLGLEIGRCKSGLEYWEDFCGPGQDILFLFVYSVTD